MNTFPTAAIKKLASENKWEEFKNEILSWFKKTDLPNDEGKRMFSAVAAHAKLKAEYTNEYLTQLKKMNELLKRIKDFEVSSGEEDRAKRIKNKIKDL